jgi:hypothetical protein
VSEDGALLQLRQARQPGRQGREIEAGERQGDAGQEFAHRGRLAEPLGRFAEQARQDQHDQNLHEDLHAGDSGKGLAGRRACRRSASVARLLERRGLEQARMPDSGRLGSPALK